VIVHVRYVASICVKEVLLELTAGSVTVVGHCQERTVRMNEVVKTKKHTHAQRKKAHNVEAKSM